MPSPGCFCSWRLSQQQSRRLPSVGVTGVHTLCLTAACLRSNSDRHTSLDTVTSSPLNGKALTLHPAPGGPQSLHHTLAPPGLLSSVGPPHGAPPGACRGRPSLSFLPDPRAACNSWSLGVLVWGLRGNRSSCGSCCGLWGCLQHKQVAKWPAAHMLGSWVLLGVWT